MYVQNHVFASVCECLYIIRAQHRLDLRVHELSVPGRC
jgi:hypothetical protein